MSDRPKVVGAIAPGPGGTRLTRSARGLQVHVTSDDLAHALDYAQVVEALATADAVDREAAAATPTLWALAKDGRRAEAQTRTYPFGVELRIAVEGDRRFWHRLYPPDRIALLAPAAEQKRQEFLARGWSPLEPA